MTTPTMDIRTLIHDGGTIMVPLVACSVLATVVIVERLLALSGARRSSRRLGAKVLSMTRRGDLEGAREVCRKSRSQLADVLGAGLERAPEPKRAGMAIERARAAAGHELKRGLWILGTIGASAPFVGLFGTVVGIIRSFQQIAATGQGGFTTVAAGISEALIATGSGIVVAVIAFAAHNYFQVRVGGIALDWKLRADELMEMLEARPKGTST